MGSLHSAEAYVEMFKRIVGSHCLQLTTLLQDMPFVCDTELFATLIPDWPSLPQIVSRLKASKSMALEWEQLQRTSSLRMLFRTGALVYNHTSEGLPRQ